MDRTEEPDAADVCVRACVRTCVRACVCVCHSDQLRRLVGFAGDVARSLYREHLGTKVRQKKGKGGGGVRAGNSASAWVSLRGTDAGAGGWAVRQCWQVTFAPKNLLFLSRSRSRPSPSAGLRAVPPPPPLLMPSFPLFLSAILCACVAPPRSHGPACVCARMRACLPASVRAHARS